jgi:hypothetical protein|mmetsp:Transcript_10413/g.19605  ORF Transcript_10413/g.19605 Transcript_10413/m.19605 type:complete len:220 (-) Transcript_10413:537-1196(-)
MARRARALRLQLMKRTAQKHMASPHKTSLEGSNHFFAIGEQNCAVQAPKSLVLSASLHLDPKCHVGPRFIRSVHKLILGQREEGTGTIGQAEVACYLGSLLEACKDSGIGCRQPPPTEHHRCVHPRSKDKEIPRFGVLRLYTSKQCCHTALHYGMLLTAAKLLVVIRLRCVCKSPAADSRPSAHVRTQEQCFSNNPVIQSEKGTKGLRTKCFGESLHGR